MKIYRDEIYPDQIYPDRPVCLPTVSLFVWDKLPSLICLCLRLTHITNAEGPYRGRLRDHIEDYDSYRYDSLHDNIVYMLPDKFNSYNQIIQYCL